MSMSINTNLLALKSLDALDNTTGMLQTSLERLSTGLKINHSSDDPSGAAIAQGMTAQINGLNAATQNAQEGVSLLQTAGGALSTVTGILQTLNTLAVTAANSATESSTDVALIQSQAMQLTAELDHIASTVNFNGFSLLNGTYSGTLQVSNTSQNANSGSQINFALSGISAALLGLSALNISSTANGTASSSTSNGHLGFGAGPYTLATTLGTIEAGGNENGVFSVNGVNVSWDSRGAQTLGDLINNINAAGAGVTASFDQTTQAITLTNNAGGPGHPPPVVANVSGNNFAGDFKLSSPTTVTGTAGTSALNLIASAITTVSAENGMIGATINRLNYTISNLGIEVQNATASVSNIQDVNMATEMSKFTRLQVLQQSGTAMLAQANQAPSAILKLIG